MCLPKGQELRQSRQSVTHAKFHSQYTTQRLSVPGTTAHGMEQVRLGSGKRAILTKSKLFMHI